VKLTTESPNDPTKILIVDDDPQILSILGRMISRLKPADQIYTAKNCAEAFNLLKTHHFKLIISDYRLPDGVGLSILQQTQKDSVRIGISGSLGHDDFKAACDRFIPKPFQLQELQNILHDYA
jgi:DNA-binding NtrC family response regulator